MRFKSGGITINASTGGRKPVDGQPWLLFLHGAGQSRLTWTQQVRKFAYGGYNVLAPDLPGHGLSQGEPIEGIEAQAEWVVDVMNTLQIEHAHLVGHSQGGITALEIAAGSPDRVTSVVFIATAAAIPANETLIKMAEDNPENAFDKMVAWGSGRTAHAYDNVVPGSSLIGAGLRIMEQNSPDALAKDLVSCATYRDGVDSARKVRCRSLCIFAREDKMTPVKLGRILADNLPNNELHIIEGAGHMLPGEKPLAVNKLISAFLNGSTK